MGENLLIVFVVDVQCAEAFEIRFVGALVIRFCYYKPRKVFIICLTAQPVIKQLKKGRLIIQNNEYDKWPIVP